MRPECGWSMSTVGLTAQETAFPIENSLLWGSYCHSMAGSKSNWSCGREQDNFYISMSPPTCHSYGAQQKTPTAPSISHERHKHSATTQKFPPKKPRPHHLLFSCSTDPSHTSPGDKDLMASPFHGVPAYGCHSPPHTPGRCSKPLPPTPPPPHHVFEQMDSELDFSTNTDESCCLVSDPCVKSPFRNGQSSRRSFRGGGQVNHAYYDGPLAPQSRKVPQQQPHLDAPPHGVRVQNEPRQLQEAPLVCQQNKAQRRLQRSHSGPAGSFNKHSLQRIMCQKMYMDKHDVPPPIPPRTSKTGDPRRWSDSSGLHSDEGRPPKVPPRDPLGSSRTPSPSPKSLPMYSNGVMPSTQSFAPDPNYMSFHRQNSEGSPCILPVTVAGVKDSDTHYYLMPQQPVDSTCVDKLFSALDSPPTHHTDVSDSHRDYHSRRNAHVHLV
ncbi:ERBB receptor feedback inhibitor 1a [Synchiropus splendidus]|uniref:ERBB receptor feedback inhibitor 1a n=1 Tax=Synchiropus splendidus TaxID=270530 RepID=UPI00237D9A9A|nr:ERBB receptor feedback inhibitor 1a [Synchiropus splendidus]